MNATTGKRSREVVFALAVAGVGVLFMIVVVVMGWVRYGVTWSFDPEFNSYIAVFIGSIAGALFTLTNAVLLYATLQAQHRAQADANTQHKQLREDRNYDRLSDASDRLEAAIAQYTVEWGPHMDVLIPSAVPYQGYSGLSKTFEIWVEECTPDRIENHLAHVSHVDPDNYLTQQVESMDIMFQLRSLIQAIRASDLDDPGREHLSKRSSTILTRISRSKNDLRQAASLLRKFVDDGGSVHPKQNYASDLLHLERKLRDMEKILPDLPYRKLTTFEQTWVILTKEKPVAMFESETVPSFQVDGVEFVSQDKLWVRRFNGGSLTVQIQALDINGKQLNYLFHPFHFSALLFHAEGNAQVFDTKGLWFEEGTYNLMGGQVVDHKRWRIDVSFIDMDLRDEEALKLEVYTNAKSISGVNPIKRNVN